MKISAELAKELNLGEKSVQAALDLINDNNTIPFIARYRKEQTGNMSDDDLRTLYARYLALKSLEEKRKKLKENSRTWKSIMKTWPRPLKEPRP
ncbi:Tex-like protein N-terminal domain protein [Peptoniphilus sp. oral taxon 375 str. F0436]|nr:Tex-like protein N-terminal domain protein [Peptoniphilus sp. oral taxon 375 str. F0436]